MNNRDNMNRPRKPQSSSSAQNGSGGNRRPQDQRPRNIQYASSAQREAANLARNRRFERELLERKARRDAERRRRGIRNRIIITLVLSVLVLSVFLVWFLVDFYRTPDADYSGRVNITIGEKSESFSSSVAYTGGVISVSFNDVADYLGMDVVGDANSMRFVIPSGDASDSTGAPNQQYVLFRSGDAVAVINGESVRMSADAKLVSGEIWVPVDFLETYVSGINVKVTESSVSVTRTEIPQESGASGNVKYEEIDLLQNVQKPLDPVEENEIAIIPSITFKNDLSEYEKYMNPEDRDAYLTLVNKENLLSHEYIPPKLTDIVDTRNDGRATQQMQEAAARALEALFIEMRSAGYTDVSVMSGYRSYDYQKYLNDYYITLEMQADPSLTYEQADAIVSGYSAKAGTSEHQLGLCIDMHNLPSANTAFAYTEAYLWLRENAWKFGFILRFPEGTYDITGYTFEPWHYRFVGRYHAYLIHEADITLEEYLETYETKK